jgi:hypothetical protein
LCTGDVSLHAQASSSGKDIALRSSDAFSEICNVEKEALLLLQSL